MLSENKCTHGGPRKGAGPKFKEVKRDKAVSFYLTENEHAQLKNMAQKAGKSLAVYVREELLALNSCAT